MRVINLIACWAGSAFLIMGCMSAVETGDTPKDKVTVGKEQPKDPKTDSLKVLEKPVKTEIK